MANLTTPLPQPVFDESSTTPDPDRFETRHPSDKQLYDQLDEALKTNVVGFDPSRAKPDELYGLESALGPHGKEVIKRVEKAGQIIFHAVGDTGSSDVRKYRNEIHVSDQLADDFHISKPAAKPAFFYHLGDVVYSFGESKYYYDQFYEPYRNYPAPIFAIPGNHDSFVIPGTPEDERPLTTFARNFCAIQTEITPEAGSLHRTAMTQPGIYFTLDAPFVRIIGLFSNALEDPGLISSEKGTWPGVPDVQLAFLSAQLERIKKENYAGAVLLATHHPPFTYSPAPKGHGSGGNHGSSATMLREIDSICKASGIYPHAFLSGHAHNYQRFTRKVRFAGKDLDVPFVVCGNGGHNVNAIVRPKKGQPAQEPEFGSRVDYLESKPAIEAVRLLLAKYDDRNYGYLRITVDKRRLAIGFHHVQSGNLLQSRFDLVTVDLANHTIMAN
jgi:predicted phosphodiesterase